jgi:hypothetical protein
MTEKTSLTPAQKAEFLLSEAMASRNTTHVIVRKRFKFSMEDLQDNPQDCKRQLLEYLITHGDKIEKVEIESEYDELTFAPIFTLRCYTNLEGVDNILSKIQ